MSYRSNVYVLLKASDVETIKNTNAELYKDYFDDSEAITQDCMSKIHGDDNFTQLVLITYNDVRAYYMQDFQKYLHTHFDYYEWVEIGEDEKTVELCDDETLDNNNQILYVGGEDGERACCASNCLEYI